MADKVTTSEMAKVQFSLPELYDDCLLEWKVHLVKSLGLYNMVIGQDIISELGTNLHFGTNTCT